LRYFKEDFTTFIPHRLRFSAIARGLLFGPDLRQTNWTKVTERVSDQSDQTDGGSLGDALYRTDTVGSGQNSPNDVRWAAYILATVKHECADRWLPIEEFGKGKGHPYGEPVTVADADGTQFTNRYYGRGFVQLTWKFNYAKLGRALGLGNGLLLHPEHALEPTTAYTIMSYGMRQGFFTTKRLSDYIHEESCDYLQSRRIINKLDQAERIQAYAQKLETILKGSLVSV
jgi:hypothetical protein